MNSQPTSSDFVLQPVDNSRLANLCGQFDEHLRQIEQRLNVKINIRGNALRIIGDVAAVKSASQILKTLYSETSKESLTPDIVHLHIQDANASEDTYANGETNQSSDIKNAAKEIIIKTKIATVKGRGENQRKYLDSISTHDITFGIGPAGTGKTFLAVACAVIALENSNVHRLVLTRPAVEAGEHLGFLPGDMAQKIDPYLRPLYDALYELIGFDNVAKLISQNIIEIAPLAFMRGRTLNDAFIILDEAQNTTTEQMKMFLTRIGMGSTVVITGDVTQIDLSRGTQSGLNHAVEVLKNEEKIGFTFFKSIDAVRHPLIQRIIAAYDYNENGNNQETDQPGIEKG
ncbi:MAG: PhoH family protein [Gammaproteobacteria bacterium]|nr:PhoH family protein [Gammaproteobacteria bacterium]